MHFHMVYETRNLINGKKYIGLHSTLTLKDGYLGSGELLLEDIKKYKRKNFKRRIIQLFDTREEAVKWECYFVDHKYIAREDTYNTVLGGNCPHSLAKEYREEIKASIKAIIGNNR